jgi:phosphatidylglycerophosphatase C
MVLALDHARDPLHPRTDIQKNEPVNRQIAFLDFDGTITTKDSLLEFIKFSKGSFRFYLGFLINSPWLLAYRTGIISNQRAKERILTWFFAGTRLDVFQDTCNRFAAKAIPGLIRPKALREIRRLRELGVEVVIVSASPANWLQPWTDEIGAALLATRLQTRSHPSLHLTGKILDRNCHGEEKICRIRESFDLSAYDKIIAYGDSSGDKPMLRLATHPFYKPFR